MKNFFKTSIFLLLAATIFQSCSSDESHEEIISDEQKITTELTEKIITTATSLNDYNFFVNNVTKSNCDILSITRGYFNNPEGDFHFIDLTNIESLDMWLTAYENAKIDAFNSLGIEFSDEDFFLSYVTDFSVNFRLEKRESILNYFENCEFNSGDTTDNRLPVSDISSNCSNSNNASINIFLYNEDGTAIYSFNSLDSVEDSLASYNFLNNTNYGLENVSVSSLLYFNGVNEVTLNKTEDLINYFENCMFSRDTSEDDCLNFVYPIEVNRFNLQLEEVITSTIENDEDLITTFNTDTGELGFVYPISLLGQNGSIVVIESNETLKNTLDNSSTYCN
jgi:hypothetical protein